MKQKKLLVIHQGALGDFVATFPGILRLKRKCGQIDVLCQAQLGRLTQYLDIAVHAYPLESAAFATLFSGSPENRMKHLLKSYDAILLFSFSSDLENNLNRIAKVLYPMGEPRHYIMAVSIHALPFYLIAGPLSHLTSRKTGERFKKSRPFFCTGNSEPG